MPKDRHPTSEEFVSLIYDLRCRSSKHSIEISSLSEEVAELKHGKVKRDSLIKQTNTENRELRSLCANLTSQNTELSFRLDRLKHPTPRADLAGIRNESLRKELLTFSPPSLTCQKPDPSQTSELIDISSKINSLFNHTVKLIGLRGIQEICRFIESVSLELFICESVSLWFFSADEIWKFSDPKNRIPGNFVFEKTLFSGSRIVISASAFFLEICSPKEPFSKTDETVAAAWAAAGDRKISEEHERQKIIENVSLARIFSDFATELLPVRSLRDLCAVGQILLKSAMSAGSCKMLFIDGISLGDSIGNLSQVYRSGLAGISAVSREMMFLPFGAGSDPRYDGSIDIAEATVPLLIFPIFDESRVYLVCEITRHRQVFSNSISIDDSELVQEISKILLKAASFLGSVGPPATHRSPETFFSPSTENRRPICLFRAPVPPWTATRLC